jgi:hypothetical protein
MACFRCINTNEANTLTILHDERITVDQMSDYTEVSVSVYWTAGEIETGYDDNAEKKCPGDLRCESV